MRKNSRILIILTAVIAVLAVGTVVLMKLPESTGTKESKATGSKESFIVYNADEDNIKKITVAAPDSIVTAENHDGVQTVNDYQLTAENISKLDFLFSAAAAVLSENKIEEAPRELSRYGLDNPEITVVIEKNNGERDTLYVGDKSPVMGEYFINTDKDSTVYTVSTQKVDTFTKPAEYYLNFEWFKVNIDDITGITIERKGEVTDLAIAEEIDKTVNDVWLMRSPFETTANDEFVDDTILASIEAISLSEPLRDNETHGTDAPAARLTLTILPFNAGNGEYGDEYTETLAIGDSSEGNTYVGYEGEVFMVSSTLLEFVNTQPFNIVNKLQAMIPVYDVKSLEISYGSETHTFDITQGDGAADMDFNFDKKSVDNSKAKAMYREVISLAVDDIYRGEPLRDTVLVLKYTGINGREDAVIEFKTIDALSCALVKNGESEFTIKKNKIEDFISKFNAYAQNPNG